MEKRCEKCNKIIIEDYETYKEKYPNETELECPYCKNVENIK